MTEFQRPSFSVKTGGRKPEACGHGWWDAKGNCCFCGVEWNPMGSLTRATKAMYPATPTEETPDDE